MNLTKAQLIETNERLRTRVSESETERVKLRYLALTLIDGLQRPALMPGEAPGSRLDYLLAQVDLHTAQQANMEASIARRPK